MNGVGVDGKIEAEGELYLTKEFWERLEETFAESPIFDELVKALEEPEPLDWYDIREYRLDDARDDELITDFPDEGDIVHVVSITSGASVSLKFDSRNADPFDLSLDGYKRIKHTFTDLYLTNDAQSGATIKILFGRGDWDLISTIAEMDIHGTIRNDQLDQITDPLKIGEIIRNSHIIPHADIACEKILLSGTTRLDEWRSTDDYTYMDPGRILLHATTRLSDWRHPTDLTLINGGQIFTHSIEANKLSILTHILSGAVWADNDPAAGSISWAGAEVTYNGNTYAITDGNTNQAYIWWDFSLSTTTFQTANVKPPLTDDDFIVCYNNAGVHELVWNATLIEGRTLRTGTVTADELNVIGINAAGRIVVGDATDADEVTAGVNAFATTLILPGKIVISGATNLEDWRAAGDLTQIDGGEIFTNTIIAAKLNITDLVDIANLLTVAAGRIVIGANALGVGLDGILIIDGAAIHRVEIGEVAPGVFATNIRDANGHIMVNVGGLYFGNARARAYQSIAQAIPHIGFHKVNLQTETYDPGTNFAGSRFTAPISGYYQVNSAVQYDGNGRIDHRGMAAIYKNGAIVAVQQCHRSWDNDFTCTVSDMIYCAATDFIEIYAYQDSGIACNLVALTYATYVSCHFISE